MTVAPNATPQSWLIGIHNSINTQSFRCVSGCSGCSGYLPTMTHDDSYSHLFSFYRKSKKKQLVHCPFYQVISTQALEASFGAFHKWGYRQSSYMFRWIFPYTFWGTTIYGKPHFIHSAAWLGSAKFPTQPAARAKDGATEKAPFLKLCFLGKRQLASNDIYIYIYIHIRIEVYRSMYIYIYICTEVYRSIYIYVYMHINWSI